MKSIFKSFALVAAAAMAFTACQNEIEVTTGGGDVEATTTVHVVANLNSTRSAFGDKIDAGYTSHWNGGEVAKAYVVSDSGYGNHYYVEASNETVVEAEDGATQAHFNLSFNSSLSNGVLYIIAAADASVIDFEAAGYNFNGGPKPKITLPTEQTPDKDGKSVDPKAHILIYKDESFRPSDLNSLEVNLSHYAAYGKLNLRNAPEGVESYILDINGNKYIINSSRTTDVWFACEPAVVVNMSVTVNAAAGAYTKKIVDNGSRELKFVKGAVSKFTVNMEGVTTGEEVDTFNPTYRLESLSWNGSGYFDLLTSYVGDGTNHTMNTSMNLRIYMHEDDRPNNNSLKLGNYSCAGSGASTPSSAGTVNMRYNADTYWGWHANADASSTLSVSAENGVYVIVATINGQTWGYKGLPEGWPAPAGGGDNTGGDDNTGGGDNTGGDDNTGDDNVLGSKNNPYTFSSFSSVGLTWTFSDAENSASIILGLQSNDFKRVLGESSLSSSTYWYPSDHEYTIDGTTYDLGAYVSASTVKVVDNGDNTYTFTFKMVLNGGEPVYYVGVGK